MTEQPVPATGITTVPEWDTADRMRKALREARINAGEMAAYLGVGRNTVSTWINGKIQPSTQTLRLWALRCGVSYEWLRNGSCSQVGDGSRNRIFSTPAAARAALRSRPAILSGQHLAHPLTIDAASPRRAA